jgi:alkylation response protein AidB-like acyl-CoA dehydrogenase
MDWSKTMTQPTEQDRPADIREAAAFANKQKCLMDGGLGKPAYWKHAMIMLADEVERLRAESYDYQRGAAAEAKAGDDARKERDGLAAKCAELKNSLIAASNYIDVLGGNSKKYRHEANQIEREGGA